jgi:hypothetical protein
MLVAPSRLLLATGLIFLSLLISGQLVLGTSRQATEEGTAAANRSWPEGAELLAAHELTLSSGSYLWHITTRTITVDDEDEESFETGPGIVIASSGDLLVQLNEVDTLRLAEGAALTLHDEDRVLITGANDDPASYLVVELLDEAAAADREDDGNQVGPLTVPAGDYTLALVNLAAEFTDDATVQEVLSDALRPGVSIIHNEEGVPDQREPNEEYDFWIVALYPVATSTPTAEAPATDAGPGAPQATVVATTPAPPASPTATLTASPTVTATSTATATATGMATNTPTSTPTVTPTVTPTATPTVTPTVTPTPTFTPTATPTDVPPTNTPEPTATSTPV